MISPPISPPSRHKAVAFSVATTAVLLAVAWSGCLGIERSEWAFRLTQLDDVQDGGLTGKGVVVGIVDSGIDPDHPSLDHVEIKAWRDYVDGREKPYDDFGHGTHVAGILAAKGGVKDFFSGSDLEGVAPAVSLVVVKACGEETCDSDAVQNGINWAVDQGVDILTLSLGGRQVLLGSLGDGPLQAVNRATMRGVYVVAAAGNSGSDHGDIESPASARLAIAVGAIDRNGRVADFSSRGSQSANNGPSLAGQSLGGRDDPNKKPELVAPGVDILSSWDDGTYASASGTSQAAPFVAGAIALFLEEHPEWRRAGSKGGDDNAVETMKQVLTDTAKAVEGGREPHDNSSGYGLLQAQAALKRLAAA